MRQVLATLHCCQKREVMLFLTYKPQSKKRKIRKKEIQKAVMLCPVCAKKNTEAKLILHQISFDEAVYLCEDRKCTYPEGYDWKFVKRKWEDMNKKDPPTEAEQVATDEIDQWLNELLLETPPQKLTGNESSNNFGADFDFDEFEKLLLGKEEKPQNQESADMNNKSAKIKILSNIQVKPPQSELCRKPLCGELDSIKSDTSGVKFEQETRIEKNSVKAESLLPVDLLGVLGVDDLVSHNTRTCDSSQNKPVETNEDLKSGEVSSEQKDECDDPEVISKNETEIVKNGCDSRTINTDAEVAQNDLTEQSKRRRSSRIREDSNVIQSKPSSKPKSFKRKSVRSKRLQYTDTASQTGSYKLPSEIREKILLDEKQRMEEKKLKLATEKCEVVLDPNILRHLKSLPRSK